MIIKIIHYKQKIKWDHEWIYIGTSFSIFNIIKSSLNTKNISLSNDLHKKAHKQVKKYLIWNNEERLAYNDEIGWWMTHHSGRNNFVSSFYTILCQILVLKDYVSKSNTREILIICEDSFIFNTIVKNFKNTANKLIYNVNFKNYFVDFSEWAFKGIYLRSAEFYHLIRHAFYARLTKSSPPKNIKGEIILILNCLDSKSFESTPISYRFFNILPIYLKDKNKSIIGIPWFYTNDIKLLQSYNNLRKEEYFIPDDYLRFYEYFVIFFKSISAIFYLRNKNNFEGINISNLINREMLLHFNSTSAVFWKYNFAIKRWAKNIEKLTLISEYENNLFEHTLRYSIKNLPIPTKTIGYFHSLLSKEFLAHHTVLSEWESKIKPDYIICMGELAFQQLIGQGAPLNKVLLGPALRHNLNLYQDLDKIDKNKNELLVLLSLSIDVCIEVLTLIILLTPKLGKNFKIRVKPHPLLDIGILLKKMNIDSIPNNWILDTGDLIKVLKNSYCCITMSTASVYDAVLCGTYVIPISSQLNIMDNYLDLFSDKFKCASAIPQEDLFHRIVEIYKDENKFIRQFEILRNVLLNGINPIDEENLNQFIKVIEY